MVKMKVDSVDNVDNAQLKNAGAEKMTEKH